VEKEQSLYLSIREASKKTSLGIRFLYELCARKQLRHFRVNRRILIDAADLESLIRRGEVKVVEDWGKELGIE